MRRTFRRRRLAGAVIALAVILALWAAVTALRGGIGLPVWAGAGGEAVLTAPPAAGASRAPSPDLMPATHTRFRRGDDWRHVAKVIAYYLHNAPKRRFVYLLGGSAARECTASDAGWRREIRALSGRSAMAFNLGTTGQSFDDEISIVRRLPEKPSIIFIGVNLGLYTHHPSAAPSTSTGRVARAVLAAEQDRTPLTATYAQHRFTGTQVASAEKKGALLTEWLTSTYPLYQERFAYHAERLRTLVAVCQARGFRPVLLNLPLNLTAIGSRLDEPRARYAADCQAVAAEFGIPYVDWVPTMGLVDSDFVDNWHLVEPGRAKWQRRLSGLTVSLLERYDMVPGTREGSGSPASQ